MLPAGGQVVSHLTLAVFAELLVGVWAGGGSVLKLLPIARLGHSCVNTKGELLASDWLLKKRAG